LPCRGRDAIVVAQPERTDMTTSELIAILQKADPSGQMKVVVIEDDRYFVSPLIMPDVDELTRELFEQKATLNCGLEESDIGRPFVAI
jgi:uncharacterized iron-regulated membrane protein